MFTADDYEAAIDAVVARLTEVNEYYIQLIAQQIKKIMTMSPTSINRMRIMLEMYSDVASITDRLAVATGLCTRDIEAIYKNVLEDAYTDPAFRRAMEAAPLPPQVRPELQRYTENLLRQTQGTLVNLSNTTAVSETYRKAVDDAILSVSTGMDSYDSRIRKTIRDVGYNGLQVRYDSGYHRRLDSAARQNIIDGVNQLSREASLRMGESLGFDAVEISAHSMSAPDHEPVQGRVFLRTEFDKMQVGADFVDIDGKHYAGFPRPITEWNCRHIPFAFSTKFSVRTYTPEQLEEMAQRNAAGCEIDGKHRSLYEATQLMRRLETEIRREKDAANACRAAGDMQGRRECQSRINTLSRRYQDLAGAAGLKPRLNRTSVEGFRAVKSSK